jgi:hypothetical protein
MRVKVRSIPPEVLRGDPIGDAAYRQRLAAWVDTQWREKDAPITRLRA